MGESFLIAVREGFEAALVVAIVLAFVRRSGRPDQVRYVWLGAAAALILAAVVGLVLQVSMGGLEGVARRRSFAVTSLFAAGLLTWMVFWMRSHARSIKGDLEARAGAALAGAGRWALAAVAFLAVVREGLETALFLLSPTATSAGYQVVAGTLAGAVVAVGLGVVVYRGSHRLDLRRFFLVTGVLIVLFAAGLVARSVLFLQASGDLGSVAPRTYDLREYPVLTRETQVGRLLAGMFGWDPRPSIEELVAYLTYLVPALVLFLRPGRPRAVTVAEAASPSGAPGPLALEMADHVPGRAVPPRR